MCIRKRSIVFPRYPLLTKQLLYFHSHPHCPSVTSAIPIQCFSASVSQCLCGKSHVLSILRPLWPLQKSQLLCNQANPASFCKTPGVGGTPSLPPPGGTSFQGRGDSPRSVSPLVTRHFLGGGNLRRCSSLQRAMSIKSL